MDAQHSMHVGRAKMAAEELRELEDAPTTILEDLKAAEVERDELQRRLEKAREAMKVLAHYADHAVHCRSLQEFHNHPCNCGLEAALRGEEGE